MNTYSIISSESVGYGTDIEKVNVNYSVFPCINHVFIHVYVLSGQRAFVPLT